MIIFGGKIWTIVITIITIVLPVMPQYLKKIGNQDDEVRNNIVTSSSNNVDFIDFVRGYTSDDIDMDVSETSSNSYTDPARVTAPLPDIFTMMTSATSDLNENHAKGSELNRRGILLPTRDSPIFTDNKVAHSNASQKLIELPDIQTEEMHGNGPKNLLTRDKRSLTFPDPSTLLLIFGLGTPLQLDSESVIVGMFTKMIYTLPSNSSDFTEPGVYFGRTKSRWSIYRALERIVELYGFGAGKGCLLRAICEVAAAPFDFHHGLFGQMAQAFLSPSSTSEAYDEYRDREYHAAERLGRHVGQNCHALYPECERNVLDIFSTTTETTSTTTTTTTGTSLI